MLGISLRDYFQGGHHYFNILNKIKEDKMDLKIQALILNPSKGHGQIRSKIEEGESDMKGEIKKSLFNDIQLAIKTEQYFKEENSNDGLEIEIKLYDQAPSCFLFITSESIIVEQYHLGEMDRSTNKRTQMYKVLGGKINLIEYKKGSAAYILFDRHFNYLWEHSISSEKWIP
jgi:hypothetical protein